MEPTESLWFWSILKPNYRWKTKNLLKTKISANTASLGISNKVSARSQKNHSILVKLSKKKEKLGTQIGSKLLPGDCAKVSSEILTQLIIVLSIYTFWMPSFSFWIFAVLNFTQRKQVFFWLMTLLDQFWWIWGGNSNNFQ